MSLFKINKAIEWSKLIWLLFSVMNKFSIIKNNIKKDIINKCMQKDFDVIFSDYEKILNLINDILSKKNYVETFFQPNSYAFYKKIKEKLESWRTKWFIWNDEIYKHPMDQYNALALNNDLLFWINDMINKTNRENFKYTLKKLQEKIQQAQITIVLLSKRHNFKLDLKEKIKIYWNNFNKILK